MELGFWDRESPIWWMLWMSALCAMAFGAYRLVRRDQIRQQQRLADETGMITVSEAPGVRDSWRSRVLSIVSFWMVISCIYSAVDIGGRPFAPIFDRISVYFTFAVTAITLVWCYKALSRPLGARNVSIHRNKRS